MKQDIDNINRGKFETAQGVLASNGMGPCWRVVVFLSENKIFIDHLTSLQLPDNASYRSAQRALEKMATDLYDLLDRDNGNSKIEYVCLFGGNYRPNDYLCNLGYMVKFLCSTPSETLLFETDTGIVHNNLLEFMNKVVSIDLNMNYTAGSSNEENENNNESDLTIIGESIDNIRRLSLAMYVGEKLLSVYVLDPTKSRPTLFFKSLYYSLTEFENKVQNKKVAFIDYAFLHLLLPDSPAYCPDAQPALSHVLNNLIPRIKPDEPETDSD